MGTEIIEERRNEELSAKRLIQDYRELKKTRQHGSMASANWVTTLAHECEAYAVYNRTVPPSQRRPMKESLGMIFSEGNDQARAIKRDLYDAGYEVEGAEDQMSWGKYQITGRQDLKIRKGGIRHGIHAEIKSCSPFTYDSIDSVESLRNHKWPFIHKWDRQVCLYMVLQSVEKYWLILKNKSTGAVKVVEYVLGDEELQIAEAMLKKAERVNHLVQIGQMPDASQKISDEKSCSECEFFTVCLPELTFGTAAKILTDEMAGELAGKTERLLELKPLAKEFEDLDEEVKGEIKALTIDGADKVVYGDYVASIKFVQIKPVASKVVPAKEGYTQKRISFMKTGAPKD